MYQMGETCNILMESEKWIDSFGQETSKEETT